MSGRKIENNLRVAPGIYGRGCRQAIDGDKTAVLGLPKSISLDGDNRGSSDLLRSNRSDARYVSANQLLAEIGSLAETHENH